MGLHVTVTDSDLKKKVDTLTNPDTIDWLDSPGHQWLSDWPIQATTDWLTLNWKSTTDRPRHSKAMMTLKLGTSSAVYICFLSVSTSVGGKQGWITKGSGTVQGAVVKY